jgi:fructose-specific phosphotransferase system IIC component
MKYVKIIIGLSGIILFIAGAAINLTTCFKLKKQGVENVFKYVKANPDKVKNAKKWGSIGSIGFWLMVAANYIND